MLTSTHGWASGKLSDFFSHEQFQHIIGCAVEEFITKELIPNIDIVSEQELAVDFQLLTKWYTSYFSIYISVGRKPNTFDIYYQEDDQLKNVCGDISEAILFRHLSLVFLWKLMNKLGVGIEKKYSKAWETLDCMFAQYASICEEETNKKYGGDKDGSHVVEDEEFYSLKVYMRGYEVTG